MEIKTFEEVDSALLQIAKMESIRVKKEAAMNAAIQKIREKYEEETTTERENISSLESDIQTFCLKNKREFEKDKRSVDLVHGSVGFRTNPPKVLQLSSKFKVATTLELIKKILDPSKYIRTKIELNKEAILADYIEKNKTVDLKPKELETKLTDEKLSAVGLRIDQEETYYYEIKWDELKTTP